MFIKLHESQSGTQVLIKIAAIQCIYEQGAIGNADRAIIEVRDADAYIYVKETIEEVEKLIAQNQNAFLDAIRQTLVDPFIHTAEAITRRIICG